MIFNYYYIMTVKILIFISLLTLPFVSRAQTITVRGHVQDKDFPTYSLDSAQVKGLDLNNNLNQLFLVYTDPEGNYLKDITTAVDDKTNTPINFALSQNYPNPFNPSTKIEFSAPKPGNYTLGIYDATGREVYLQTFSFNTGHYSFNVSDLGAAGVYFYRIISHDKSETKKMVLLDGGSGNVRVDVTNGNPSSLNKVSNLEMRILASKQGYFSDSVDVSYVPGGNYTQDFSLSQIPKKDTIHFYTHQNLVPTNTPGDNASVIGTANGNNLFNGTTNSNGDYTAYFIVNFIVNPSDTSQKIYTPSQLDVNISRDNTTGASAQFTINGSDITWNNNLQQTLINKNGNASGHVKDDLNQPIQDANVKVYNNDNNQLFNQGNSNASGDYSINYTYQGYEKDPNDEHTPINNLRLEASAQNHTPSSVVKPFENPVTTNFTLDRIIQTYNFNATLNLYKTFKGQSVTDLDSVFVQWPDGTIDGYQNNNGHVNISKDLTVLNSDTTAQVFHKHPEQYLKWMVFQKVNPNRPDWISQNANSTTTSTMPLNIVNSEGTVEVYMVPKWANYGPNNDIPMDMESSTVAGFYNRNGAFVSGFRPFTYDTTYVFQFTFNESTGEQIDQANLDRAANELNKFIIATHWPQKNLLIYQTHQANSVNDALLQWVLNGPRNQDNFTYTSFYNGPPGNAIDIATDGTLRIKNSNFKYNTGNTNSQIQDEIIASMLNIINDNPTNILAVNISGAPYTDLAQNLIGISYIFKPGTQYIEQ